MQASINDTSDEYDVKRMLKQYYELMYCVK